MKLSQTDQLLSNIHEYHNLLGFLNEKHPEILNEWKNKGAELAVRTPQPTDDSNHKRLISNGNYRDK